MIQIFNVLMLYGCRPDRFFPFFFFGGRKGLDSSQALLVLTPVNMLINCIMNEGIISAQGSDYKAFCTLTSITTPQVLGGA